VQSETYIHTHTPARASSHRYIMSYHRISKRTRRTWETRDEASYESKVRKKRATGVRPSSDDVDSWNTVPAVIPEPQLLHVNPYSGTNPDETVWTNRLRSCCNDDDIRSMQDDPEKTVRSFARHKREQERSRREQEAWITTLREQSTRFIEKWRRYSTPNIDQSQMMSQLRRASAEHYKAFPVTVHEKNSQTRIHVLNFRGDVIQSTKEQAYQHDIHKAFQRASEKLVACENKQGVLQATVLEMMARKKYALWLKTKNKPLECVIQQEDTVTYLLNELWLLWQELYPSSSREDMTKFVHSTENSNVFSEKVVELSA
jgi:hypothetical protein